MNAADHRLHMARQIETLARGLAAEARSLPEADDAEVRGTLRCLYDEAKRLRDNRARVLGYFEDAEARYMVSPQGKHTKKGR